MPTTRPAPQITLLLTALAEAFDRRSWHGTNLLGSLRGMTPERAVWRPAPGRHNCWELLVHAAYWKYAVTRRLTGAPRGSFPLKGSNFFPRPDPRGATRAALTEDLTLLKACHADLLDAVGGLSARSLSRRVKGSKWTVEETVRGAAAHDLYHAGQIQLIKRLAG